MIRTSSFLVAGVLGIVVAAGMSSAQPPPGKQIRSTAPKPEARPDEVTVEADTDNVLDVLANDIGVPPPGEYRPRVEVRRLDDEEARRNMCGTVRGLEAGVFYRASADCIGKTVRFGYKVKLFNAQTNEDEEVYSTVTVKVVARSGRPPARQRYVVKFADPQRWREIEEALFEDLKRPATTASYCDTPATRIAGGGLVLNCAPGRDNKVPLNLRGLGGINLDPNETLIAADRLDAGGFKHLYTNKVACGGKHDLDRNAGEIVPKPIENIVWETGAAPAGKYTVEVNRYTARSSGQRPTAYTVELKIDGATVQTRTGEIAVDKVNTRVLEFELPWARRN